MYTDNAVLYIFLINRYILSTPHYETIAFYKIKNYLYSVKVN